MATMSQYAGKIVIALAVASCGLLALVHPNWGSEVRAQDYPETDDVAPGAEHWSSDLPAFDPHQVKRRYLVTYIKSNIISVPSSATVVSVTNLTREVCHVSVEWFRGLTDTNDNPSCITDFTLGADLTADFCSRDLPTGVTSCNSICDPELDFHEGRALVGASCEAIGVSGRVYYTGEDDTDLEAITDPKIIRVEVGSQGD